MFGYNCPIVQKLSLNETKTRWDEIEINPGFASLRYVISLMLSEIHLASCLRNGSPCSRKMPMTDEKNPFGKHASLDWCIKSHNAVLSHIICAQVRKCIAYAMVRTITHIDMMLCYSYLSDTRQSENLNHKCPHHKRSQVLNPNQHKGPHLDFKQLPPTTHPHTTTQPLLPITGGSQETKLFPKRRKKERFQHVFFDLALDAMGFPAPPPPGSGERWPKDNTIPEQKSQIFCCSGYSIRTLKRESSSWIQNTPCTSSPQHQSYCILLPNPSHLW